MQNRIGLYLVGVVACLVLATLWAVLAVPETALAGKGGKPGKPGSDPSQLLVDLVNPADFDPVDRILVSDSPGDRPSNLLDDLVLEGELPAFAVAWEDPWAVEITPAPPSGGSDPVTLNWKPFLITEQVNEFSHGVSFRISEGERGDRYLNDFSTAPFDPRLIECGGDVELLLDANDSPCGFIVHVHADGVPLHGQKRKDQDKVAGTISIGDLVFKLDSDGDGVPDCD